jgi:hypothetical protein
VSGALDFSDVAGDAEALDALPPERNARLFARWSYGPNPLAAGAALLRRGDLRAMQGMLGAAAFVAPEDLASLRCAGAPGADALAAVMLCAWVPSNARVAAAEALAGATVSPASYAALREVVAGPKVPVRASAERVLADVAPQAHGATREQGEQWRLYAAQVREGRRNPLQKQELQRAIAAADVHPVMGLMVADDGAFLAGLLPPIDDAARAPALPFLLATARTDKEALRGKVFGVFQRRWRELAAGALSAVARTPMKAREAGVGAMATKALAAMGATEALVAAAAHGATAAARAAALTELAKLGDRLREVEWLTEALALAEGDADAAVQRGVASVRGAMGAGG